MSGVRAVGGCSCQLLYLTLWVNKVLSGVFVSVSISILLLVFAWSRIIAVVLAGMTSMLCDLYSTLGSLPVLRCKQNQVYEVSMP